MASKLFPPQDLHVAADLLKNYRREIIDESDVFVDVHKAIRRMAPAPKSRVPKGKIVEEPPQLSSVPQGELIGVNSDSQELKVPKDAPVPMNRRRSSLEAPPLRFQLRRQTTGKDSEQQAGLVTQRGATDEIREHLKHLGPSNLASRPRQTRYQNVKIKRGGLSPTRFPHSDTDSPQTVLQASPQTSLGLSGGIGAGVLNSAGMDARDGVHALKLGYGTMDGDKPKDFSHIAVDGIEPVSVPEPVLEEQDENSRSNQQEQQLPPQETGASSIHSGNSQSEERPKPGNYRHPGPARSGSITEQVIDVNGVRKVVLHTTSSSDGDEGRSPPPSRGEHPMQYNSKSHLSADDKKLGSSAGTNTSSAAAKKKRRRKKRAGQASKDTENQPNEQQPLLS